MGHLDEAGDRDAGKTLVVKQVGKDLSDGRLTALDARPACLCPEGGLHAPRIVRSKRLLVDRFENSNCL